jgi:hypothetical protein
MYPRPAPAPAIADSDRVRWSPSRHLAPKLPILDAWETGGIARDSAQNIHSGYAKRKELFGTRQAQVLNTYRPPLESDRAPWMTWTVCAT